MLLINGRSSLVGDSDSVRCSRKVLFYILWAERCIRTSKAVVASNVSILVNHYLDFSFAQTWNLNQETKKKKQKDKARLIKYFSPIKRRKMYYYLRSKIQLIVSNKSPKPFKALFRFRSFLRTFACSSFISNF